MVLLNNIIDKFLAYKIAGSGFKLLEVGTGKVWEIDYPTYFGFKLFDNNSNYRAIKFDKIGTDYKIISRTMDLTKPITLQGKEVVPIVELLSLITNSCCYKTRDIQNNGAINGAESMNSLVLKYDSHFTLTKHNEVISFNQTPLDTWLEKHQFCYFLPKDMIVEMNEVYNN